MLSVSQDSIMKLSVSIYIFFLELSLQALPVGPNFLFPEIVGGIGGFNFSVLYLLI